MKFLLTDDQQEVSIVFNKQQLEFECNDRKLPI